MLDFKGFWVKYLPLMEFAYNNSFQASIGMVLYEVLYGGNVGLQSAGMKWVNGSSVAKNS